MKSSIDNHKIFRSGSKKDINVIKSLVSEEIKVSLSVRKRSTKIWYQMSN